MDVCHKRTAWMDVEASSISFRTVMLYRLNCITEYKTRSIQLNQCLR